MNIYKNNINKEQRGRPTTPMQTNTGKYLQHKTKPKENEEQLQNIRVCVWLCAAWINVGDGEDTVCLRVSETNMLMECVCTHIASAGNYRG